MNYIDKILLYIERTYLFFSTLLLILLIIINTVDIFYRLVWGSSITATQELSILCFSWMVFLGMSVVLKRNLDPKITLFLDRFLPRKYYVYVDILVNLLIMVFLVSILYVMNDYLKVQSIRESNYLPMNYMYFSLPVVFSFIYMLLFTLKDTVILFKGLGGSEKT